MNSKTEPLLPTVAPIGDAPATPGPKLNIFQRAIILFLGLGTGLFIAFGSVALLEILFPVPPGPTLYDILMEQQALLETTLKELKAIREQVSELPIVRYTSADYAELIREEISRDIY